MSLGLNIGGNAADIVPRVRFDARVGRLFRADRVLAADGRWTTEPFDISQPAPTFIMDIAGLKVGWLAFGPTGPDHRLVPLGEALPPQPSKDHKQGFQVRIYAERLLGGVREFASTAKVVISAMDALHSAFEAAPERAQGLVPVVSVAGTTPVTTRTPQGSSTNYAPVFRIDKWVPRPAELEPTAAGAGAAPTASPPAGSVPPAPARQTTPVPLPPAPATAPVAHATEF